MGRSQKRPAAPSSNVRQSKSGPEGQLRNRPAGAFQISPIRHPATADPVSDAAASQSSEPHSKRLKFADEAVTIIVGGEKLSFVVHKRLLCEASTFFKNALCGYTQDGAQKSVAICSVEPTTFESFLQWLYSKSLAGEDMMQGQETSSPIFSWSLALKLYTLSHYLQCPAFGSSVIDYIRGRLCDKLCLPMPTAREITEIYSQTPGDCGLRRLITLMHTTMARGGALLNTEARARAWIADVPTDFIKDLAVRLLQEDSGWIPGFWGHGRVVQWIMDGEAECQAEKKGSETVGSIE